MRMSPSLSGYGRIVMIVNFEEYVTSGADPPNVGVSRRAGFATNIRSKLLEPMLGQGVARA